MKRILIIVGTSLIALVLLIQLIPYGHDHSNPPIVAEPEWPNSLTRTLAQRACFDCHSNETKWPLYSNFAPASWLVYRDVTVGKTHINFSDWNRPAAQHVDEFKEVFNNNSMPPQDYLLLHPDARLTIAERQVLFNGLIKIATSYQH